MLDKDKQYTLQEVLSVFSKTLAKTTAEELTEMVTEKGLSTLDEIGNFVSKEVLKQKKDYGTSEFGKAKNKALTSTERLIRDSFPSIDFEGLEGQEQYFEKIANHTKVLSDKSNKDISYEKAMQVPEIASKFKELKAKASQVEELQASKAKVQKNYELLNWALPILEEKGAQFSKNAQKRKKQINALLSEIDANNWKPDGKGGFVPVNEDGEILSNPDSLEAWDQVDYLKTLTIVDFAEPTNDDPSNNRGGYVPDKDKNKGLANFGYTKEQISGFTSDDLNNARREKQPEKAQFILNSMIEREKQAQQKTE